MSDIEAMFIIMESSKAPCQPWWHYLDNICYLYGETEILNNITSKLFPGPYTDRMNLTKDQVDLILQKLGQRKKSTFLDISYAYAPYTPLI